jgi:hypothetical protein
MLHFGVLVLLLNILNLCKKIISSNDSLRPGARGAQFDHFFESRGLDLTYYQTLTGLWIWHCGTSRKQVTSKSLDLPRKHAKLLGGLQLRF